MFLVNKPGSYVDVAIKHSKNFVRSGLRAIDGVVKKAKRLRSTLAGDHVLPISAIKKAIKASGVTDKAVIRKVWDYAHSAKNLRLMDRALNSSKGARNALQFMKTPLGSQVPRKYIQNILRKQYTNAKHIEELLGKRGLFDFFFGR